MCFPDLTMCPAMNGKNRSQYMYMVWAFFFNISNHIHVTTVGMTPPPLPLYLLNIKKIACHQSKLGFVHTYEFKQFITI